MVLNVQWPWRPWAGEKHCDETEDCYPKSIDCHVIPVGMPVVVRLVHLAMIEMMSAAKLVVMAVEKTVRTKKGSVACTIHLTMAR